MRCSRRFFCAHGGDGFCAKLSWHSDKAKDEDLFEMSFLSSNATMTVHIPVLPEEVFESLNLKPGQTVVDGTLGGGGHSRRILDAIGPDGHLIAVDRDPNAVDETRQRFPESNATLIAANYADIPEILQGLDINGVDGILLDLGLSSDQLEQRDRGFSFAAEGSLDLRFDPLSGDPAWKLVQRLSEKHLANLIYQYGEEKLSRRIARKIVRKRNEQPIETSVQLAQIVRSCFPKHQQQRIDPATRTFQALRIAVNEELKWLGVALKRLPECLHPDGRISIISFHSLEDRMVKQAFVNDDRLQVISRKPITAGEVELEENPRCRSAKLRVAQRRHEGVH